MKRALAGLCMMMAVGIPTAFSAQEVFEFDSPEQENIFKKLGNELRCPKCQNNNIADSNSSLAQDLRTKVYEMLKQGRSEDEIVDYMIDRYGNFVTYNPPLSASTLILWVGPFLFLAMGFGLLVINSRNPKPQTQDILDSEAQARLHQILNDQHKDKTE